MNNSFLRLSYLAVLFSFCLGGRCSAAQPEQYQFKVLATKEHDTTSFTQGFEIEGDWIYESSGLYGKSKVFRYNIDNNEPNVTNALPNKFFAEGLTLFGNNLYLLTWREGKAFVFKKDSLKQLKSFNYEGEGWGLTHNDQSLIMSNGSSTIVYRSPKSFEIEKTITVHSNGKKWDRINELEYVDGIIWANQWQEDILLGIDANTGEVRVTVDIESLQRHASASLQNVANGIAYDKQQQAFWITGKNWRYRYLLKLLPSDG